MPSTSASPDRGQAGERQPRRCNDSAGPRPFSDTVTTPPLPAMFFTRFATLGAQTGDHVVARRTDREMALPPTPM